MGAAFNYQRIGSKTEDVSLITRRFAVVQEDDIYENGNSYSGGFGMCASIENTGKTFKDEELAANWLTENAQKWGPALLVSTEDDWIIGAWCSC